MFCSNCGNKLIDGAKFCSECGAKVAVSVEIPEPAVKPEIPEEPFPAMPVIPQQTEAEAPEAPEPVVPKMPETVVSETPMGSVEMPTEQPNTPVRTRLAFDWSNVKEEPHRRPIPNVKSPWEKTGGIDEDELYAEMKPSNDRSRTMNFIDVLKAEREEAERNRADKLKEHNFDYTEVLHLDLDNLDKPEQPAEEEQPKLHYAPLFDDLDSPVSTPFDEPKYEKKDEGAAPEETAAESPAETEESAPEKSAAEKPAWKWFEMPDFLKPKAASHPSVPAAPAEKTIEENYFEEPKYEKPEYEEYTDNTDNNIDNTETETAETAEATEVTETVTEPEAEAAPEPVIEAPEPEAEPEPVATEPETVVMPESEAEPELIVTEPETVVMPEPEAAPEPAITEAEPEPVSDAEPDYSDYLNMDMERPAADDAVQSYSHTRDLDEDLADIIAEGERSAAVSAKHAEPEAEEVSEPAEAPEAEAVPEPAAEPEMADVHVAEAETEDAAIDEAALFAEMQESAPAKTGMTIAAPADKESEIEALKQRLAELMGGPAEAPADAAVPETEDTAQPEPAGNEPEIAAEPESIEVQPEPIPVQPETAANEGPIELILEPDEPVQAAEEEVIITSEELSVYAAPVEDIGQEVPADDTIASFEDELASFLADAGETYEEPVFTAAVIEDNPADDIVSPAQEPEPEVIPVEIPPVVPEEEVVMASPASEPAVLSLDDLLMQQFGAAPEEPVSAPALAAEVSAVSAGPIELEPVVVRPEPEHKPTDAMSLEDLESDLFGETPSAAAEAEMTKKIDKFYTLYRKNEEFQKLLDEEYNKLKTDTEPSPVQKEIAAAMGTAGTRPEKMAEDRTIYQGLEELKGLEPANAAQPEPATPKPAEVKAPPVEIVDDGLPVDKLSKKERKKAEKEQRRREKEREKEMKLRAAAAAEDDYEEVEQGSTFLTIIAVIIAILLVFLLAVILVLNFAPDSGIALQIDSVIENITSHFGAVDAGSGEYLL